MYKKRTTTRKTKKRKPVRRTMKAEKEEPNDQQSSPQQTEAKSAFMEDVDRELEALRGICYAFEGMDQEMRIRTFNYLKARYGQ